MIRTLGLSAVLCLGIFVSPAHATDVHVSPSGTPDGDGSPERPLDLQTALDGPAGLAPGDTIWLHAGTYRGLFTSRISGTEAAPIHVRAQPGERVILEGPGESEMVLSIESAHVWFQGFEVTSAATNRESAESSSWPSDIALDGGIEIGRTPDSGTGVKLIHLTVHDTRQALSLWEQHEDGVTNGDTEVHGCLFFHSGWIAPDRGHGHQIYTQNRTGTVTLEQNVVFGGFGYGLHAYGSDAAYVDNYLIRDNVFLNNGSLADDPPGYPGVEGGEDVLLGGARGSTGLTATGNVVWGNDQDGSFRLGFFTDDWNRDVVVTDNTIAGSVAAYYCEDLTFRRNRLLSWAYLVHLELRDGMLPSPVGWDWDANEYVSDHLARVPWQPFGWVSDSASSGTVFPDWQAETGFDADSTYTDGVPTGTEIRWIDSVYDPDRSLLVAWNWDSLPSLSVDPGTRLSPGDSFRLRDAQDPLASPRISDVFTGAAVEIDMTAATAAQPSGWTLLPYVSSLPRLGVFILERVPTAGAGAPNPVVIHLSRADENVLLTWEDPPTDATHDLAETYRIHRSVSSPISGWELLLERLDTDATTESHLDFGAVSPEAPGSSLHFYSVIGVNSGGASEPGP
ncbi:MAG: right-handed parallel beta-helix repeat-containing protein [Acidobacteriota bacterium]